METEVLSIPEQIKIALDGRTQRWLSFEIRLSEDLLSKKMKGAAEFSEKEKEAIEKRLNFKFK